MYDEAKRFPFTIELNIVLICHFGGVICETGYGSTKGLAIKRALFLATFSSFLCFGVIHFPSVAGPKSVLLGTIVVLSGVLVAAVATWTPVCNSILNVGCFG